MTSAALSNADFRRACGQFATGVAIAAVLDEAGNPHGLTINSFTSVSLEPPLVLICIDYRAAILQRFLRASHFGLSILKEDQRETSNRFAGPVDDRFDGVQWHAGPAGAPLLDGSLTTMECATRQVVDGGDHAIFLAQVMGVDVSSGAPLLFFESCYQKVSR
ncbi:MAG TPA: flavin reductase family protein [Bryobacteraceae bacterium]|nr:flavin reductase family protein [Bryobacteraceae bacterium]